MLMLLSPSSPTVSTTPLSMSVSTFLPCKQVHQYHFSRLQHRFAVKKIATQEHQCIYKKMAQQKNAFSSQWRKNEVTLEERQYSDSTTLLQSTTTKKIVVTPTPAKGKSRGETTLTRLHPGATNAHQVVSEKEEQETGSLRLSRQQASNSQGSVSGDHMCSLDFSTIQCCSLKEKKRVDKSWEVLLLRHSFL